MKMPYSPVQIPRALMPQVGKHFNEFLNYLKENGVSVRYDDVMPHTLKSSQSDFNPEAVESMMKRKPDLKPIFVSGDNHIMDGHHRWLARLWHPEESQKPIRIMRTNNNIMDLIAMARRFPKTEFRDVTNIIKEAHKYRKKPEPIDEMMTLNRHPMVSSILKLNDRADSDWMHHGDALTALIGANPKSGYLGSGVYGTVYAHKNHVIKVYRQDPAYEHFLDYAKAHQDDPHMPKIYAHKTIDLEHYVGVVKMEHLEPMSKEDKYHEHNQLAFTPNSVFRGVYQIGNAKTDKEINFESNMKAKYPTLHNTLHQIGQSIKHTHHSFDIHSENIMKRIHPVTGESTLVLTDPLVT